jgi:hypothetical protein
MAVDIEALKALGLSDQEINQLVAIEAGGFPTRAAAPQQVTNRVAGAYDYTPLYGAGEIIPGLTAEIFNNLGIPNPNIPVFELLGSANKGGNNANERLAFAAQPGQSFRLVNNATGQVVGEARTPEEISSLVAQSNALSKQLGKKADLSFEQSTPEVLGGGYSPIFEDQPNILFDTPMKLIAAGMLASTAGGLLQPGGLGGVGAAGTTGATTAGATGTGLIPGALEGLSFAPVGTAAVPASTIAGAVGAAAVPAAAAAGDLVVTALIAKGFTAAQAAALVASGGAAAALASTANAGTTAGSTAPSSSTTTPSSTTPPTGTPTTSVLPNGAEIVLTGSTPTNLVPASLLAGGGAAAAAAANAAGSTSTFANEAAMKTGMTPEEIAALNAGTTGAGGVLGTGLSLSQLATLGSLGASAIGSLFGGGGGGTGGAAGTYTSALGPMPSFGGRAQINPNITDYEKYGFGPEAQFFSGGQGLNTYTPPAATTPAATTPAATTPAATTTTTNLLDSAASTGGNRTVTLPQGPVSGGSPIVFQQGTPVQISPTARETNVINNATAVTNPANRVQNLADRSVFDYYKNALETTGAYVNSGFITPEQGNMYNAKLNAAMAAPNTSLEAIRAAAPMPQYTYTAPTQPITDPNRYINDLYKQIGSQYSQGLLNQQQARGIQGLLQENLTSGSTSIDALQNIYNTEMQKYKPLI